MKKRLVTVLVILIATTSFGQYNKTSNYFDWDKVRYGGRVNLDISGTTSSIILSPSAVYKLTKKFSLGGSVSFGYTKFGSEEDRLYNYGFSVLSYYYPNSKLQFSAELDESFVNGQFKSSFSESVYKYNDNYHALYLGVGHKIYKVVVGMRYDVLHKESGSLFASPFSTFVQVNI